MRSLLQVLLFLGFVALALQKSLQDKPLRHPGRYRGTGGAMRAPRYNGMNGYMGRNGYNGYDTRGHYPAGGRYRSPSGMQDKRLRYGQMGSYGGFGYMGGMAYQQDYGQYGRPYGQGIRDSSPYGMAQAMHKQNGGAAGGDLYDNMGMGMGMGKAGKMPGGYGMGGYHGDVSAAAADYPHQNGQMDERKY